MDTLIHIRRATNVPVSSVVLHTGLTQVGLCVKIWYSKCYIHRLICTCCKVGLDRQRVCVCRVIPQRILPHKQYWDDDGNVGRRDTKISGTQETSFGRKGPVIVSPMQFDWLCYMFLCSLTGCVTFPEHRTVHHRWQTHSTTLNVQVIDINMEQKKVKLMEPEPLAAEQCGSQRHLLIE